MDPTLSQLASRTQVGLSDVVLALAAGCAGALAFTTGVSAILVGVMVAVALLPPMVTFGLLLGGGQLTLAMGALSLLLANLICLNLAGVVTFMVQGIRPATWWEKDRAKKATRIAIALWATLLVLLVGLILLLRKG
ncbi:MAG: TIGR00341 family protein [Gallionella sp.]